MQGLRISEIEAQLEDGTAVLMASAGEFTGIYAPLPVDDATRNALREHVMQKAQYYMDMPDDAVLTDGEDITLAEIKDSIRQNIEELGD